ncbi:MAG: desulfoferrodoxin [Candidatus Margulisiibacteriota bacterium]
MGVTAQKQIYKCNVCGNVVEVILVGGGELTCCKQPMQLMVENTIDASKEKHIPVIEKTVSGYLVKVGSVPHPMEEKHYIVMIELIADGFSYRKYLKPTDKPEAQFEISANKVEAREYCNLHGLWKS